MGAFTTAALAAGSIGLSAYGQYQAGKDQKAAANYNAALYNQQAQVIDVKKDLTAKQYDRMIKQLSGETVSAVASSGYDLSGSFLEVMNDRLTQAQLEKQTEIYNLEVSKSQAISSADEYRRTGKRAMRSAYVGMGTTLLTAGNSWYQKYGGFGQVPKPVGIGGGSRGGTTFGGQFLDI